GVQGDDPDAISVLGVELAYRADEAHGGLTPVDDRYPAEHLRTSPPGQPPPPRQQPSRAAARPSNGGASSRSELHSRDACDGRCAPPPEVPGFRYRVAHRGREP